MGRPRKNPEAVAVDPREAIPTPGATPTDNPKPRRGRPPGSKTGAKKAAKPEKDAFKFSKEDVSPEMLAMAANLPTTLAGAAIAKISKGKLEAQFPEKMLAFNAKAFEAMVDGFEIEISPTKAYLLGTAATLVTGLALGAFAMMANARNEKARNEPASPEAAPDNAAAAAVPDAAAIASAAPMTDAPEANA